MAIHHEREVFLRYLKERDMRVTGERLALFEEIFTLHDHIDADALHRTMLDQGSKISRATVYRNLDVLVECGLVRKYRLGKNRFLYEHIHPGQRHDHLVCRECGRVVEFASPAIAALQREICKAHGFDEAEHSLQISSLCLTCRPAESEVAGAGPSTDPAAGTRSSSPSI